MLTATSGLVLHTTNYSESSVIAKIFTRELGVRGYILKGVRNSKSKTKQNLLRPLSHLSMVVYDSPKSQLNYIKEMKPARHYNSTACDPAKGSLVFFIDELLYKTLKEGEPVPEVFDMVTDTLQTLETGGEPLSRMPLSFMLKLSRLLGVAPLNNYSLREPYFDLMEGRYLSRMNELSLDREESLLLHEYIDGVGHDAEVPMASLHNRQRMLNRMIDYYRLHVAEFGEFRSCEILHEVLV